MVKALQNIDCSSGIVPALRSYFESRLCELIKFRKLVLRSATVENVHDMRVAVRRLRSALGDFALKVDPAAVAPLKKRLRKVAAALGEIRDKDVAITELKTLRQQTGGEVSAAIRKLVKKLRKSRKQSAEKLANDLPGSAKLKSVFNKTTTNIEQHALGSLTFGELATLAVESNLAKFRHLSLSVNEDTDSETLHDLRISAKKLRYSIELFKPCVNPEFAQIATLAADLQTTLGEAHDADVWIDSLTQFSEDQLSSEAADWLISRFQEKRVQFFGEALKTNGTLLQLTADQFAEHFSESPR
jgi:CHAD domain-containing protein